MRERERNTMHCSHQVSFHDGLPVLAKILLS